MQETQVGADRRADGQDSVFRKPPAARGDIIIDLGELNMPPCATVPLTVAFKGSQHPERPVDRFGAVTTDRIQVVSKGLKTSIEYGST